MFTVGDKRLEYCSNSSSVIAFFSSSSVLANSLLAVALPAMRCDEYENFSVVHLRLASQYPTPRTIPQGPLQSAPCS
jgi:hypothetical protein